MRRSKKGALRVPFVIARSNKKTRDWFRGTMLFVRRTPSWFLRIFEIDRRMANGPLLDFGNQRPDGVVACGVPLRFIERALAEQGYHGVPVSVVPQENKDMRRNVGSVVLDIETIAKTACDLFAKRGCHHVAYVGAHVPSEIRMSRMLRKAVAAQAEKIGLTFSAVVRKTSLSMGVQISDQPDLSRWLAALPKPCGILTWNDNIGRDILDLCRLGGFEVPGAVYVLGIDDNDIICESSLPTLSSIQVDYEHTAYEAAKLLDGMMTGRTDKPFYLSCGVKGVTERASTQDPRGTGRLVALARDFIAETACQNNRLDQHQLAAHLGVSVRTLQLRFKESSCERTILQEIQYVRLKRVCWLLTHTNKSISDITFEAGFRSQSRLKAIFQRQFKVSMRQFRKSPPPQPKLTKKQAHDT